jgi:adenosylhomocysteine nucleosidase
MVPEEPARGPGVPSPQGTGRSQCSLLLFLATPAEEEGLGEVAQNLGLPFDRIRRNASPFGEEYRWLGPVGNETLIAISPARDHGRLVMGSIGFLGTAARAMRVKRATGAQGIVQLGMAFGVDPWIQSPGDVLVSTSIIPYDNRDISAVQRNWLCRLLRRNPYGTEYLRANRELARPALVERFRREQRREGHRFRVYLGAMLSGAAKIGSSFYRDELVRNVPAGEDPIVGGEMEGVGLLAASAAADDPIWCVVKGIFDFADGNADNVNRRIACRNAAQFVLSALLNDAAG